MEHVEGAENEPLGALDDAHDASDIDIRLLSDRDQLIEVEVLFQQIWGSQHPMVAIELLRAISYSGGYIAGAFEHGHGHERLVGASVGFLGRFRGELCLHSHITGILAGVRSTGLGRKMKQFQREWCADNDISWITWNFDPLVRRNAWFNLEVLKVEIADYLVDFFGPMDDMINVGDQTDRLVAAWPVDDNTPRLDAPASWGELLVDTPENIVNLRRTDPAEAERWRTKLRADLGDPIHAGAMVTGFTRGGQYVVRVP